MTRANIELGDVTHHNLKQLKKINTVVLPVLYNDKFYLDVLESGELAKLAYYNDVVVGAVCSRIDTTENMRRLYIMTLGCLYPYRRLGIGSVMVKHILNYVEKDGNFDSIFLHVKVDNEGAIEFYKKFGFEIVETKQHYYKRIEPADAHVLQKTLVKRSGHQQHHHHNGISAGNNSNNNNNNQVNQSSQSIQNSTSQQQAPEKNR